MGALGAMQQASTRADEAMCLAEEIRDILEDMRGGENGTERVQFVRRPFVIQTDATGGGSMSLSRRAGVDLELISMTAQAPVTSSGVVLFYMDQSLDPTSLLKVVNLAQYTSDTFAEGDRIPAGRDLAVSIVSGPANSVVTVNVSGKVHLPAVDPMEASQHAWTGGN